MTTREKKLRIANALEFIANYLRDNTNADTPFFEVIISGVTSSVTSFRLYTGYMDAGDIMNALHAPVSDTHLSTEK